MGDGGGPKIKATWDEKLRYRVDTYMARGTSSLLLSLLAVFFGILAVILLLRFAVLLFVPDKGSEHVSFFETFLEMTDPGNLAGFRTSSRWFRLTAVLATVLGIVFLSSLIAILTTSLDRRLANLRRGRSRVLESGHTIILGWSPQRVLEIIRQLAIAHEFTAGGASKPAKRDLRAASERVVRVAIPRKRPPPIVILGELPKEEMDEFLALHLKDGDLRRTRVITRSGDPADRAALRRVSVRDAESAIVLSGVTSTTHEQLRDVADAHVIKTLLAVSSLPGTSHLPIVAEVMNPDLEAPVRQISAEGRIKTLCPARVLAKILFETSRSVGLSPIYRELLSFEGAEFYFTSDIDSTATRFGDLAYRLPDGVPIGYRNRAGGVVLNPPPTTELTPDDEPLLLADDDSTIHFSAEPVVRPDLPPEHPEATRRRAEKVLVVGWTAKSRRLIESYAEHRPADQQEAGGSIDVLVAQLDDDLRDELTEIGDECRETLTVRPLDPQDPAERSTWSDIDPFDYDNILILANERDGAGDGPGHSVNIDEHAELIDARTIMVLFLLRAVIDERGDDPRTPPNVITELVGSENEILARQAKVSDFVVSPSFVSMLLAQISEEPGLDDVYRELFKPEGSAIYLTPPDRYYDVLPEEVSFGSLIAVAQQCGEVCLGVKRHVADATSGATDGVDLNPAKHETYSLREQDRLIVLAQQDG